MSDSAGWTRIQQLEQENAQLRAALAAPATAPDDVTAAATRLLDEATVHADDYGEDTTTPGFGADLVTVARYALAAAPTTAADPAEVARLRKALVKYGAHTGMCGPGPSPSGYICVCGLYDLIDIEDHIATLYEDPRDAALAGQQAAEGGEEKAAPSIRCTYRYGAPAGQCINNAVSGAERCKKHDDGVRHES